jgi:hypothetical protein
MLLITKAQRAKLLKNGANHGDHKPVVKLFTPDAQCTWLLSELDPADSGEIAFGLCDLGQGCPELGYVSVKEIRSLRGCLGLPVERERWFTATKTLEEYAEDARQLGCIRV